MVAAAPPAPPSQRQEHSRRLWIQLGGALTAISVLVACCYVLTWFARGVEHGNWTYSSPGSGPLRVVLTDGDLTLRPADTNQIAVRADLEWSLVHPQVTRSYDGHTLRIDVQCVGAIGYCRASVSLAIPKGLPIQAETTAGDISAVDLTGALNLSSEAGDVQITNSTGDIDAHSMSGNVEVNPLSSQNITATSFSGEINVYCTKPPSRILAKSLSGDVQVTVPPGSRYRLNRHTTSGQVNGAVADYADATASITADSTSGNVGVYYG